MLKSKRILATIIAICLLATSILPVMMLGATTTQTPEKMYQIKLSQTGASEVIKEFKSLTRRGTYVISFDYFLSDDTEVYVKDGGSNMGKVYLQQGKNSFYKEYKLAVSTSKPGFALDSAMKSNTFLYVWNIQLIEKGSTTNIFHNSNWSNLDYVAEVDYNEDLFENPLTTMYKVNLDSEKPSELSKQITGLVSGEEYEFSFGYFLSDDTDCIAVSDKTDETPLFSEALLQKGKNTFTQKFIADSTGKVTPAISALAMSVDTNFYIWSFSLKKTGEKTNLAEEVAWNNASLLTEMDYNEDLFVLPMPDPEKMYKVSLQSNATSQVYKLLEGLTAGEEYELYMDYFLDNTDFSVRIQDITGNAVNFTTTPLKKGRNTLKITFKAGSGRRVAAGIWSSSMPEKVNLYIWNYSITKKGDSTNLVESKAWSNTSYITEMDFNEELFVIPPPDTMYQVVFKKPGEGNSTLYKEYRSLTEGKKYTVTFEYFLSNDNFNIRSQDITQGYKEQFALKKGKHKFTFTFEATSKNVAAGIWTNGMPEDTLLFVWNYALTEAGSDTNLVGTKAWGNAQYVTEIPYDESLFVEDKGEMYQIILEEQATSAVYKEVLGLSIGEEYEVSFDYYLSSDDFLIRCQDITGRNPTFAQQELKAGKNTFKTTFKLENTVSQSVAAGLWSNSMPYGVKMYVWNYSVVKKGTTNNLAMSKNWNNSQRAIKMTYDESLFTNAPEKMYKIDFSSVNESSASVYKEYTSLKEGREYYVTFEYYLSSDACKYVLKDLSGANEDFKEQTLKKGRNKISVAFTAGSEKKVTPAIFSDKFGKNVNLFVWNFSLHIKDNATNLVRNIPWSSSTLAKEMDYDDTLFTDGIKRMYKVELQKNTTSVVYKHIQGLKAGEQYVFTCEYYLGEMSGSYRFQDITGDRNGFKITPLKQGKGKVSITFTAGERQDVAPGVWSNAVGDYDVLYIWNFSLTKKGEKKNLALSKAWNNNERAIEMLYDESKFKRHPDLVKGSKKMLQVENYYYDKAQEKIIIDREFCQYIGSGQNGSTIKEKTTYVFSCDYYCTENIVKGGFRFKSLYTGAGLSDFETPNVALSWNTPKKETTMAVKPGRNSFTGEFTTRKGQTDFLICYYQGQDGTTTIWNMKLVEKGTNKNLLVNPDFEYSFAGWKYSRDTVDETKPLGLFSLLEMNKDMINLKAGEFLPDPDQEFYDADLWADDLVQQEEPKLPGLVAKEVEETGFKPLYIILIACTGLLIIAGGIVTLVVIRKKKKA